jgi:hypothetical protein
MKHCVICGVIKKTDSGDKCLSCANRSHNKEAITAGARVRKLRKGEVVKC